MVFRILCAMALPAVDGADNPVGTSASSAGGGSDLDDVHIFIRKHVAQSQVQQQNRRSQKRVEVLLCLLNGRSGGSVDRLVGWLICVD